MDKDHPLNAALVAVQNARIYLIKNEKRPTIKTDPKQKRLKLLEALSTAQECLEDFED